MRTRVVHPGDPDWDAELDDLRHDVYHLSGYHSFEQWRGNGEPRLVVVESGGGRLLWPYLLRRIVVGGVDTGRTDVTSAYGYSGPLASGPGLGAPFLAAAWQEMLGQWRAEGVVSVFARLHPLLGNDDLARMLSGSAGGADGVLDVGQTVSVDCTAPDEEVFADYARPLRRHLAHAAEIGYVTAQDVSWSDLPEFVRIYNESMDRNAAADFYRFTADDFTFLRDALPGRVHLLLTRGGDEVVAGGLFTESSGIVQAHLMGTATAHLSTSPGKALLDGARRWAREAGHAVLHLGGGRGGRCDSLFRFKREFSKRRHPFAVGRWIVDPVAYTELTLQHDVAVEQPSTGFFPAYRAPVGGGLTGGRERAAPAAASAAQHQANRES